MPNRNASLSSVPTRSPVFSLCVFCGSRSGDLSAFAGQARIVGRWIGTHGGQLVYGGSHSGLMGLVADATLEAGGRVVGVIPRALVELEYAHRGLHELHIVETMHERKRIMAERCDAFLALPGGIGTLEEFFEVWTWRQLKYHDKPIGLLNHAGYFDALLLFLNGSVTHGFMHPWQLELIEVGTQPESLLNALLHLRI